MTEVWRRIPGTGGRYLASTRGHIRSVDVLACTNGRLIKRLGRVLKTPVNGGGYPIVSLCVRNKVRTRYVHDLVLETFTGPKPLRQEARHLDDVKVNCDIENLRYGTRSENIADRRRNGIRIGRQVFPG